MQNGNKENADKLLQLVQDAMRRDKELRDTYQIGEKFRFIHDRLKLLLTRVEETLALQHKKAEENDNAILEDEMVVYVYLYNAHGLVMKTWQKMLNPQVFYEYSVNRPIYVEKSSVEAFIRVKTTKAQHGYLQVIIKKSDVIKLKSADVIKDMIGSSLIKVREGSLHFHKLISFTHNGHDYAVKENGELLTKKN